VRPRLKPERPLLALLALAVTIAAAILWYRIANVIEADAFPQYESRAQAQLVLAVIGCVILLAGNLPAWRGRGKSWAAIEGVAARASEGSLRIR
jgi:hypothetical protein